MRIAVPKKVIVLIDDQDQFFVKNGIDASLYAETILEIKKNIESGRLVPEKYYRKSTGIDYLLKDKGWLHLHVGVDIGDNDTLLIVEEGNDAVLFIALTDHSIFNEQPRAKGLSTLSNQIVKTKSANKWVNKITGALKIVRSKRRTINKFPPGGQP